MKRQCPLAYYATKHNKVQSKANIICFELAQMLTNYCKTNLMVSLLVASGGHATLISHASEHNILQIQLNILD